MLTLATVRPAIAQNDFYGLPLPSIGNYIALWEQITGIPYRDEGSTLLVGDSLGNNKYELWAVQMPTSTDDALSILVGTITVHQQYNYTWVLPVQGTMTVSSGSMDPINNPNGWGTVDIFVTLDPKASSIDFVSNIGDHFPLVADFMPITFEALDGSGSTASMQALLPYGVPSDILSGNTIAELIATFPEYTGDVVDPNTSGGGGSPPNGGNNQIATQEDIDCAGLCALQRKLANSICTNNLNGNLRTCRDGILLGAGGGCLGALALCAKVPWLLTPTGPWSVAVCCAGGAIIGGGSEYFTCKAIATSNAKTCYDNADAAYGYCMSAICHIASP